MSTLAIIPSPELVAEIEKHKLDRPLVEVIAAAYAPSFIDMRLALETSKNIKEGQPAAARASRLELKRIRTTAEGTRVALKASVLQQGKAIDGTNALLLLTLKPEEERLDGIEQAEARAEAARKSVLASARRAELGVYTDTTHYNLADMPDDQYAELLDSSKTRYEEAGKRAEEARKKAAEKAENDAKEAEQKRKDQEVENKRLADEADKARANAETARKELQAAQDKLNDERKKAAEAQTKADYLAAENKRLADWKKLRESAPPVPVPVPAAQPVIPQKTKAALTDGQRLMLYANALLAVEMPTMNTDAGKTLAANIVAYTQTVAQRIIDRAAGL